MKVHMENVTVRFFVETEYADELIECDVSTFEMELENGAVIKYERHTVYANGVRQICLTASYK